MLPRSAHLMATALSATLVLAPFSSAMAGFGEAPRQPVSAYPVLPEMSCGGDFGGKHGGGGFKPGGGTNITINKPTNIYKPITINKNVNVFKNIEVNKPITVNKNIEINKNIDINKSVNITKNIDNSKNLNIYKPITINKNIDIDKSINISKNIDASKNIEINKNIDNRKYIDNSKYINIEKKIIINKGGGDAAAMASAMAIAVAAAAASASATASVNNQISIDVGGASASARAGAASIAYVGGSYESVTVNNYGSFGELNVSAQNNCVYQEATVIKAIHAVCVSAEGREFAATHMTPDTWINSSYEGEVVRCIAGSRLKVTIGQVVQSDHGMATTYGNGQVLMCEARESIRHYKDGLLKCAPASELPDCTERTNLRKYGSGDLFFSYRTQVCAEVFQSAAASSESYSRETEIQDLSLSGGVGGGY